MKKIIPYIASQFKKDKIWLRRNKPSKRQYQVMLAIDDSRSMADSKSVQTAYETIAMISSALTQLEVGAISIVNFGHDVALLHPFEEPFDSEAGAKLLSKLTFKQDKTFFGKLVQKSMAYFESSRNKTSGKGDEKLWQLEIIISDGHIPDEDPEKLKRMVRTAAEKRIFMVFIIIDQREKSITETIKISQVDGKITKSSYIETFPFEYFLLVRDIQLLPEVLSDALRQWFEIIQNLAD